ncbi:MAG: DNA-binding response regulator [Polyangiales bacterium]
MVELPAVAREDFGVVVLDDDVIAALEISRTLRAAGFRVVASLSRALDFFNAVTRYRPSLAFVDVALGGHDGIDLVATLPANLRPLVVYVSGHDDSATVRRAAESGCVGFVVKPFEHRQLVVTAELGLQIGARRATPPVGDAMRDTLEPLTQREQEVALSLFHERRVSRVSRALFISPHTVRNHLKAIFAKVGVHSQEELFDLLERRGAVVPDRPA